MKVRGNGQRIGDGVEMDVPSGAWLPIARDRLAAWNDTLLETEACRLQYPYWNEPYRRFHMRPTYLAWGRQARPSAYICILTLGIPPLRIGLVQRGPVLVSTDRALTPEALRSLYRWMRAQGYAFVRMTHEDGDLLNRIAATAPSERIDAFPFYPDGYYELVIEQLPSDEQMLAGFDREARRKIRRAQEVGYRIDFGDTPEMLAEVWPLFLACAARKGFALHRPLEGYLEMVRRARLHGCVRIYTVSLGERIVEASLVFRDRTTACCLLAAMDAEALQGRPSPSVLLHWRTMRDFHRMGAVHYNLGPGPGSIARFKDQFSPLRKTYPPPVTLIVNRPLYRLWHAMVPLVDKVSPIARLLCSRRSVRAASVACNL